jgi:transposase
MFSRRETHRILAYGKAVDMRKSFTGLIALTKRELKEDPLSGTLFVFINRRGNYLKSLYWDRTGYCLFAKKLERGRFKFPGQTESTQELSEQILKLILDGIELGGMRKKR